MTSHIARPPVQPKPARHARHCAPSSVLVLMALALLLTGCAAKRLPPPPAASQCWAGYLNQYATPVSAPGIATSSTLSWRQGKKTARVTLDLWGNFESSAKPVFRMDAWSNVGGNLSYLMEDTQGIVALYPDPLRVYTHTDPVTGARMLGLPFPFSLSHLASLLAGDFGALTETDFFSAVPGAENGWEFTFASGPVTKLGLDALSRPLFMEGPATAWSEDGRSVSAGLWRIEFSRYDEPEDGSVGQPARMDLTLPPDAGGILRIKARELTVAPWPDKATELIIPDNAQVRPLDHSPRDWTTGNAPEAQEK